jgi:hypothetical protein
MEKTHKQITIHAETQAPYQIRREQRNGREYMVVPVIMMVEGVHNGSGGPVLHLQSNFSQNPSDWNGAPLTAGHPRSSDGEFVSVTSARPEHWVVGYVANTKVEDGKLKADAFVDVRRAIAINPEIVNYLNETRPLDVSTGAITRVTVTSGEWQGEAYESVTQEYNPDHLALLPGDKGACSWADGCGIRTNQNEESNEMSDNKEQIKQGVGVINGLQSNEAGYLNLVQKVQSMLNRRESESRMYYLKELYDDHFVYKVSDRDRNSETYYKQNYSYNEDNDDITLLEGEQEVIQYIEYRPVQRNQENSDETSNNSDCGCSMKRTKFETNNNQKEIDGMSDSKNTQPSGDVMEKVVSLVNNERTHFTKADREWLLQMNEAQLNKFEPSEAPEREITREEALQALSEDLSSTDKLLEIVSDDVKAKVQHGITAYEEQREKLIKSIQANTEDIWAKEKLEGMDTETLTSIEKSSRKTDYSGQGPVVTNNSSGHEQGGDVEQLLPAGVTIKQ